MLMYRVFYKKMKKLSLTGMAVLFVMISHSQTNQSIVHQALQRISNWQSKGDNYFSAGIIPTFRAYEKNSNSYKPDNNVFTTGVIVFMLQKIRSQLVQADKIICDSITQRAIRSFPKFKNKKGRNTYNFWTTDTVKVLPNAGWMNWFTKKETLPDDMDDTVMLLMAMNANKIESEAVHAIMQPSVNCAEAKYKYAYKELMDFDAYTTYFGKKTPIDFDICVQCNVLYFVSNNHLIFTKADSATVQLIVTALNKKYHLTAPDKIAPVYISTPIILYHLSRLMALNTIKELDVYKSQLITDANKQLAKTNNIVEKIILQTALMRWGIFNLPSITFKNDDVLEAIEKDDFIFYTADLSGNFKNPLRKWLIGSKALRFNFYCPAYNDALFLENLVLSQAVAPNQKR